MPQPVTTLLCFAVKEEARPYLTLAGTSSNTAVIVTGMGAKNTEKSFLAALTRWQPSRVITSGFAGALNPNLALGTVVFDVDSTCALTDGLRRAGAKAVRFHCAAHVAATCAEKAELLRSTGADVVEMESEIIRQLCRERNIPSATVRVISDTAEEDLPLNFNELMTPEMNMDLGKLALKLIRNPGKIPELMKFQKRVTLAANNLASTLKAVISP